MIVELVEVFPLSIGSLLYLEAEVADGKRVLGQVGTVEVKLDAPLVFADVLVGSGCQGVDIAFVLWGVGGKAFFTGDKCAFRSVFLVKERTNANCDTIPVVLGVVLGLGRFVELVPLLAVVVTPLFFVEVAVVEA